MDREPSASLQVLLGNHCDVVHVVSASAGIPILQSKVPSVAIVGLGVPEFERRCFASALDSLHDACPLIVLATQVDAHAIGRLARFPISAVCQKPVAIGGLVASIGGALGAGADWPSIGLPVGRAVDFISQQYAENLTVESAAGVARISPSRLAHLFQRQLRSSVKRHIARVRIEVAKRFLDRTPHTLEDIAAAVGLWDASHLSRLFLRHTLRRPSEYRRAPHAGRPIGPVSTAGGRNVHARRRSVH